MWLENHNESIRCDNAIFNFDICLNKTNTYSSEWVLISCVNAQRINVAVYSVETRALIHSHITAYFWYSISWSCIYLYCAWETIEQKSQRERKEENNFYHRHTDEESRSCCCCFEAKRRIVERNEKKTTQQQQQ